LLKKIIIAFSILVIVTGLIAGAVLDHWYSRGGPIGPTGLKVILSARQDEFRLGEPMRFRVVVQVMELHSVKRDFQCYSFDIFEIKDPDGNVVSDVLPFCQSMGKEQKLLPFQTLLAWEDDILLSYPILMEGEYSIQVRALSKDLPESNVVTFLVKGGTVPEVDNMIIALRKIVPERWHVGRGSYQFESYPLPQFGEVEGLWIQLFHPQTSRGRIDIFFTQSKASDAEAPGEESERLDFLGRNELGNFYFHRGRNTEKTWPSHFQDIRRALALK
jgi:hypothetical protein